MEILRKLRWVLYPTVFVVVLIFASYCTFPRDVMKDMAQSALTHAAMGMGPRTRGVPEVSIKDISFWGLSGVNMQDLKIIWPAKKTELPVVVEFSSLKARVGLLSALSSSKSYAADIKFYDGDLEVDVAMRPKNELGSLMVDGTKINLAKMAFVEPIYGAPLFGILNVAINLASQDELTKDGTGNIKITIDNFSYGPGSFKLPTGGIVSSLTVPKINLGKLTAELSLDKGQLESKTFTLTGGDLEADLKISAQLGRRPASSRINGDGWFSMKKEFVNNNETLKTLYELMPELQAAHQGDGKVGLSIRGNMARPDLKLENYSGAKPAPTMEAPPVEP